MRAAFLALYRSVTRLERAVFLVATLFIIVVTALPPLYGWMMGERSGKTWIARQYLAPADFSVYFSAIDQAKSGAVMTENLFTTEPMAPRFNALWYSVGRFADLFSLTPTQAFHLARLLLIPALAAVSYLAVAYFLADRRHRLAAFLLFMFGSGLGTFAAPFLKEIPPSDGTYLWPIDFWDGEANTFMTMGYSPHFVASLCLWLLSVLVLAVAYEKRSLLGAAAAGLIACALFQFHPYHAPVIYAVAAAWCALMIRKDGWRRAPWLQTAAFIGVSAPAVAYHFFLTRLDAHAISHALTNYTMTPPIFFVLVGLGAISVLWIPGARSAARSGAIPRERLAMLLAWVVVQGLLVYAPFRFQRRFLEGLQFPLTILAVPALFDLYERLKSVRSLGKERRLAVVAFFVGSVFLISTAISATRNFELYSDTSDPKFYVSTSEARAMAWLRSETPPDAVILSTPSTGNTLVPLAGRRVYAGHWSETIGILEKAEAILGFYRSMDGAQRARFIREHGITHVYVGPDERSWGARPFGPEFARAFEDGRVEIYVLKEAAP